MLHDHPTLMDRLDELGRAFWAAEGQPEERKRLTAAIHQVSIEIRDAEQSNEQPNPQPKGYC